MGRPLGKEGHRRPEAALPVNQLVAQRLRR
jgi:hypothetical protein